MTSPGAVAATIPGDDGEGVAVVIPCLDEATTVAGVVRDFRAALPAARIVVFDNTSADATAQRAAQAGAEVASVTPRGKGNVLRAALRRLVDEGSSVVIMVDGDATYDAAAAPRLVAAVHDGHDLVLARRVGSGGGRYRPGHQLGNRLLRTLLRLGFGRAPRDPLTGYRALSADFARRFPCRSSGFTVETEMDVFALATSASWCEVAAPYASRPPGSSSKLRTLRDGVAILVRAFVDSAAAFDRHPTESSAPTRPTAGTLLSAAGWAAAATAVATVAFLAGNAWWLGRDPEPLAAALREALPPTFTVEGSAAAPAASATDPRSLRDGAEPFNDCLIPIMALATDGPPLERLISAQRVYRRGEGPQRPCDALEQLLYRGAIDPADYLVVPYHQYWNGHRVPLRALAPRLGVVGLQRSAVTATWGLLAAIALLAASRALRAGPRPLDVALLAFAVAFATCGDLTRRAASFTTAPSNLLVLALMLGCALSAGGLAALPRRSRLLVLAAFGALLGYFALFFGTVLIGLVAVLLLAAASPLPPATPSGLRWRLVGEAAIACAVGIVGSLALHAALAAAVFDGAFAAILDQLHHRMTGDPRTTMDPLLNPRYTGEHVSLRALFERLDSQLWRLGFGSQAVGRVVSVAALTATPLIAVWRLLRGGDPARWTTLLCCWIAVPAWYLTFLEHSITHAGVMVRLLFLTAASALTALGWWWLDGSVGARRAKV
ncbi:MAG: glycosyltransferase [Acidobacteria bacterium]|nr:MAG: glycosyltransferase [Acidobacteriota bacterium]REK00264.1 MAG: glycosyltransferase [Acidobacteriota bacterium]